MYRLVILVASISLAAGCGGDSQNEGSEPAPIAGQPAGDRQGSDSSNDNRESKTQAKRSDESASGSGASGDAPADPGTQAVSEEGLVAIRQAAIGTLELFGLKFAGVQVRQRGRSVTVFVARSSACLAVAQDEPQMADRIRRGAPIVKEVSFKVAGTGQLLGYYVLSCARKEIPAGPGKVVLRRTGVGGPTKTKRFTIRGKRWAIEYENGANYLAVLVLSKREDTYHDPISSQKREVGRIEYKTGPGRFQLQIQGGGGWTIRVRDER